MEGQLYYLLKNFFLSFLTSLNVFNQLITVHLVTKKCLQNLIAICQKKKTNQASGPADADYCQTDVRNRQKWADALNW